LLQPMRDLQGDPEDYNWTISEEAVMGTQNTVRGFVFLISQKLRTKTGQLKLQIGMANRYSGEGEKAFAEDIHERNTGEADMDTCEATGDQQDPAFCLTVGKKAAQQSLDACVRTASEMLDHLAEKAEKNLKCGDTAKKYRKYLNKYNLENTEECESCPMTQPEIEAILGQSWAKLAEKSTISLAWKIEAFEAKIQELKEEENGAVFRERESEKIYEDANLELQSKLSQFEEDEEKYDAEQERLEGLLNGLKKLRVELLKQKKAGIEESDKIATQHKFVDVQDKVATQKTQMEATEQLTHISQLKASIQTLRGMIGHYYLQSSEESSYLLRMDTSFWKNNNETRDAYKEGGSPADLDSEILAQMLQSKDANEQNLMSTRVMFDDLGRQVRQMKDMLEFLSNKDLNKTIDDNLDTIFKGYTAKTTEIVTPACTWYLSITTETPTTKERQVQTYCSKEVLKQPAGSLLQVARGTRRTLAMLDFEAAIVEDAEITSALNAIETALMKEEFTCRNVKDSAEITNPPPPTDDTSPESKDAQRRIEEIGQNIEEANRAVKAANNDMKAQMRDLDAQLDDEEKAITEYRKIVKKMKDEYDDAQEEKRRFDPSGDKYESHSVWQRAAYAQIDVWTEKLEYYENKMLQQRDLMQACTNQQKLVIDFDSEKEFANETVREAVGINAKFIEEMQDDFSNILKKCHTIYSDKLSELETTYSQAAHAVDAAQQFAAMVKNKASEMERDVEYLRQRREKAVDVWLQSATYFCQMKDIYGKLAGSWIPEELDMSIGRDKLIEAADEEPSFNQDDFNEAVDAMLGFKTEKKENEDTGEMENTSTNAAGGRRKKNAVPTEETGGFEAFKKMTENIREIAKYETIFELGRETVQSLRVFDEDGKLAKIIDSLPVQGDEMANLMEKEIGEGHDHFLRIKNLYCQFYTVVQDRVRALPESFLAGKRGGFDGEEEKETLRSGVENFLGSLKNVSYNEETGGRPRADCKDDPEDPFCCDEKDFPEEPELHVKCMMSSCEKYIFYNPSRIEAISEFDLASIKEITIEGKTTAVECSAESLTEEAEAVELANGGLIS